jgi:hypothetical protein
MPGPMSLVEDGVVDHPEPAPSRHERVRFQATRFVGLTGMRDWLSFEACEFEACEFVGCNVDATFCGALAYPESASQFHGVRFVRSRLSDAYLGAPGSSGACSRTATSMAPAGTASTSSTAPSPGVVARMNLSASSGPISRPPPFHHEKLPPRANVVTGNDFSRAELQALGLRRGVAVDEQRWPDDPSYVVLDRIPERVAAVFDTLDGATDGASRSLALMLATEARTGQDADIYRFDDPAMPPTHHRMVRLLADVAVQTGEPGRPA